MRRTGMAGSTATEAPTMETSAMTQGGDLIANPYTQ
jgi:hypothetical protein